MLSGELDRGMRSRLRKSFFLFCISVEERKTFLWLVLLGPSSVALIIVQFLRSPLEWNSRWTLSSRRGPETRRAIVNLSISRYSRLSRFHCLGYGASAGLGLVNVRNNKNYNFIALNIMLISVTQLWVHLDGGAHEAIMEESFFAAWKQKFLLPLIRPDLTAAIETHFDSLLFVKFSWQFDKQFAAESDDRLIADWRGWNAKVASSFLLLAESGFLLERLRFALPLKPSTNQLDRQDIRLPWDSGRVRLAGTAPSSTADVIERALKSS